MYRPDTDEITQEKYDQMIRDFSDEERFLRGISLTHFSRQLCMQGIRDEFPDLTDAAYRLIFFERIYGNQFKDDEKDNIKRQLNP